MAETFQLQMPMRYTKVAARGVMECSHRVAHRIHTSCGKLSIFPCVTIAVTVSDSENLLASPIARKVFWSYLHYNL